MKHLFTAAFILSALVLFLWLPDSWLIYDVDAYFNMALALSQGEVVFDIVDPIDGTISSQLGLEYTLGNSCWLAFWIFLLGKKYVFVGSAVAVLGGIWLTYKSINKLGFHEAGIWWLLLLLPLHFYSKSLMSSVPSFLISSLFLYLLVHKAEKASKWFLLCLLATFAGWFREVNVALLGGICLAHFLIERKHFICYAAGSILGTVPRFVSASVVYDDPWMYIFAEPMQFRSLIDQAPLYLFLIVLLFPGLIFFLMSYRGQYFKEIIFGCLFALLAYWSYAYDATEYSGFLRGSLVNSRFLLVMTPFIAVAVAWYFKNISIPKWMLMSLAVCTMVTISVAHWVVKSEHDKHYSVSQYIEEKYGDKIVYYDRTGLTNIPRYINPLATDMKYVGNITRLGDIDYLQKLANTQKDAFAIVSLNMESALKSDRSDQMLEYLSIAEDMLNVSIKEDITIEPGLSLRVYQLSGR